MNLKNLDNQTLLENTLGFVRQEREILIQVLHHLREIERRRLFNGCRSLFEFCTKHVQYSEDQASRRISAMRLLKELPEMVDKISAGDLNLSHINAANVLFNQEKKRNYGFSKEKKLEVIEKISGKSARAVQALTLSLSSNPDTLKRPDRIKPITLNEVEVRFNIDSKVEEKIEILKGLLAHKNPNISLGELFEKLCDLGIATWDPGQIQRKSGVVKLADSSAQFLGEISATSRVKSQAQIRREVYQKAKNKCEICDSAYALEIDHIIPKAKGGMDMPENLRLLCRSCNQQAAIREFGLEKMEQYLN